MKLIGVGFAIIFLGFLLLPEHVKRLTFVEKSISEFNTMPPILLLIRMIHKIYFNIYHKIIFTNYILTFASIINGS